MEKYDVFKSQGGYAVALAVYLECPVMGMCMWFETKEQADDYALKRKKYDEAYADYEQQLKVAFEYGLDEIKKLKIPKKKDFGIIKGERI